VPLRVVEDLESRGLKRGRKLALYSLGDIAHI
jgi:hypothetical protein